MDTSPYQAAPWQLDKICRACLTEKSDMKSLYHAHLDEMLNSVVFIEAQPDDGLPSLLCSQCVLQCVNSYTFKQRCEKSDRILREFIRPEFEVQLQEPVSLVDTKVELCEGSEVNIQHAEIEHNYVKAIEPESDYCTDSDINPDLYAIERNDDIDQILDIIGVGSLTNLTPPPDHKCLKCDACFLMKIDLKAQLQPSVAQIEVDEMTEVDQHAEMEREEAIDCKTASCADSDTNSDPNAIEQVYDIEQILDIVGIGALPGLKPPSEYKCPKCGAIFLIKSGLKAHLRTHSKRKPYACTVCGKAQHDDGLPSLLCPQCVLQCIDACSFKELCEKSDNILREFIKPEFQAQLQESVSASRINVEIDKNSEADQCVHLADESAEGESNSESDSGADSNLKPAQNTPGTDHSKDTNNKIYAFPAAELPPTHACTICGMAFTNTKLLNYHTTCHHSKKPSQCNQCDKTFSTIKNLAKHKKTHMKSHKLFSCSYCNKQYVQAKSLKIHVRTHTGEACSAGLRSVIGKREKRHSCPVCGKRFTMPSEVKVHMSTHTGFKPHKCETCGKAYAIRSRLKFHQLVHAADQKRAKVRSHVCETCGRAFFFASKLAQHQCVHTRVRPFKCATCGKCYVLKEWLVAHARTHIRSHVCETCGKAFLKPAMLAAHLRAYGEGHCMCETCERCFSKNKLLIRHMRVIHTDVLHVCDVCGKKFHSSSGLAVHTNKHTGGRTYRCNKCDKKFKSSGNLKKHLNIHLSEQGEQEEPGKLCNKNIEASNEILEAPLKMSKMEVLVASRSLPY